MFGRFTRILAIVLIAGSIAAPLAVAKTPVPDTARSTQVVDDTLTFLSAIESVHVGANATVITIQNGSKKPHPIVIDYGSALLAKPVAAHANETSNRTSAGSSAGDSAEPKGITLGQIAAVLLGLAVAGRMLSLVRRLAPQRRR